MINLRVLCADKEQADLSELQQRTPETFATLARAREKMLSAKYANFSESIPILSAACTFKADELSIGSASLNLWTSGKSPSETSVGLRQCSVVVFWTAAGMLHIQLSWPKKLSA